MQSKKVDIKKWNPGPKWLPCGCTGMGQSVGYRPCTPQEVKNGHVQADIEAMSKTRNIFKRVA